MIRTRRLFVALAPGEAAVRALTEAQAALRRAVPEGVRWVDPAAAHLTLRFLGNVPEDRLEHARAALAGAAGSGPAFHLRTGGLGAFPSPHRPSVLWLGIGGELDGLSGLEGAVARRFDALGDARPPRRFVPHLTLGRVRPGAAPPREALVRALRAQPPAPARWPVAEVLLIESELRPEGARYTTLERLPLGR